MLSNAPVKGLNIWLIGVFLFMKFYAPSDPFWKFDCMLW